MTRLRTVLRGVGAIALAALVALALVSAAGAGPRRPARPSSARTPGPSSPPAPAPAGRTISEAKLRAFEAAMLGPQHAAEHAAVRQFMRQQAAAWAKLSKRQRAAIRRRARHQLLAHIASGCAPSECGSWDTSLTDGVSGAHVFGLPDFAIHMALLPTGKVITWGWPYDPTKRAGYGLNNQGDAWLWDPSRGTGSDAFTHVPPPSIAINASGQVMPCSQDPADCRPVPLYCSGESLLANGDLFIAGGNLEVSLTKGLNTTFTFDPFTEQWFQQGNMDHGRWYPGQVLLPSGRVAIVGGTNEQGGNTPSTTNTELEVWPSPSLPAPSLDNLDASGVPPAHVVSSQPPPYTSDRNTGQYPRMAVLPTGNVLLSGPNNGDVAILDTTAWSWRTLAPFPPENDVGTVDGPQPGRVGGNSVLLPGTPSHPSSTVMEIGGYGPVTVPPNPPQTDVLGTATTAFLDASASQPAWQAGPSMSVGRDYQNSVLLPDGKLVTIGGGYGVTSDPAKTTMTDPGKKYWTNSDAGLKTVDIYDPATNLWTTGPSQDSFRAYHSTAMLLPNGDVLSAGDDAEEYLYDQLWHSGAPSFQGQAEIYKPWYDQGQPRITQYSVQSASPPRQEASLSFPVIHPGETFQIPFTPATNGQKLSKVVLMAPSAVTHADDMSQREVPLTIDCVTGNTATVTAPANLNVAPPGYYMLFLVDQHNVPSNATGHFVQLVPGSVGTGPRCTTPTTPTTPATPATTHPKPKAKVKLAKTKLATVRSRCRLGVSVNLNMAATAGLTVSMSVYPKGKHPKPRQFKRASSASLRFAGAGSRNASLKLSLGACRALRTAAYARFEIRLMLVAPSITAASGPFDLWLPPKRRRHHT